MTGRASRLITGGDAVAIDPKYRDAYAAHIPAVILAVNNNPMQFSDRSGGISRRRVILPFPEAIAPEERDPLLLAKITEAGRDCASPDATSPTRMMRVHCSRRSRVRWKTLGNQRHADPLVDFCGYLTVLGTPEGMMIGNANITPPNPRRYLYHAYLSFMAARGYQHVMNLTAFGQAVPQTLKITEHTLKRRTSREYRPTWY